MRRMARSLSMRASVSALGDVVEVAFDDGFTARFHALWLRDNCASRRNFSNQKSHASGDVVGAAALSAVRTSADGARVLVEWAEPGVRSSEFDAAWLHQHSHRPPTLRPPLGGAPRAAGPALPRLAYDSLLGPSSERAVFEWTRHLAIEGLCIIEHAPEGPETVCTAAERIAPVLETMYGRAWDVVETPNAINVAYTSAPLALHMDLTYYESPPGLQLLHCRRFDPQVEGGESVLLDAIAAAADFGARHPIEFETLSRVPATFMKEHSARERPVCMRYRRPHIALNRDGEITAVFWSPPFEGPLSAPLDEVPRYYEAYRLFDSFLDGLIESRGWTFRLRPGEIMTFNNRRILHGRKAFLSNGGTRALRGCYVNIDDFASRFATLSGAFGEAEGERPEMRLPMLGNQDPANGIAPSCA
jgi:gamma-butyrobetaine dioxygenase